MLASVRCMRVVRTFVPLEAIPMSDDICTNCKSRRASVNWVGSGGGVLDYVHGNYTRWCEFCAVTTQVAHCRDAASRLPELEARLADLEKADVQ